MPTYTTHYQLAKPLVNDPVDEDLWGGELNTDMDTIDSTMYANSQASVPFVTAEENLAAATTTDLGSTTSGNVYITGTGVSITSLGTVAAGIYRKVRFAGANTLNHNNTSLILPGAANISTAANDEFEAISLGSGNWVLRYYTKADGRSVVDTNNILGYDYTADSAVASGSGTIPRDNTKPQNTEGNEFMTLSYTPQSATSILRVDVVGFFSNPSDSNIACALFRDSDANAIATGCSGVGNERISGIAYTAYVPAVSTSATTFKVRAGASSGTTTFNGEASSGLYGATIASSISVTELRA